MKEPARDINKGLSWRECFSIKSNRLWFFHKDP